MRRLAGVLVTAALMISVAACSSASAVDPTASAAGSTAPAGASVDPGTVGIDAKDIAFTESTVTAPAGRPFQIVFNSQDSAPHNVTIVASGGGPVFTGDVVSGPGSTTYAVPALKPGTYQFRCDVHPNMTGTLVVK